MTEKRVWLFNEADTDIQHLLGYKGRNLVKITNLGLPVPPGLIISTETCLDYLNHGEKMPAGLMDEIKNAIKKTKETISIKDYSIKEAIRSQDNSIIKNVLYAWFTNKKDMIRGRIVGEVLSLEDIPEIYVKSIKRAKEIADEL